MLAAARMEEERGTRRDDGWEPDPRDHHEVERQPQDQRSIRARDLLPPGFEEKESRRPRHAANSCRRVN